MNKTLDLLSSRPFTYALSGVGLAATLLITGPLRVALGLGLALHFGMNYQTNRKRLQRIGLPMALTALLAFTSVSARAMIPVFDASSFASLGKIWSEDISTGQKILQEIQQMQKIYATKMQKYQLAQLMAQAIKSKNIFAIQQAIRMGNSYVVDHYGESAAWSKAVNLGISIPLAYQNATLQPQISGGFLAAQQLQKSYHLAALARVGITDDINQRVLGAVSQINQQQTSNASAVGQWQNSVLSPSQELNTAAAQQNLTNLGMLHLYEQGRAQLTVNSLLTQSLMVQNMERRDSAVSHLNFVQDLQTKGAQFPAMGGLDTALATHPLF